MRHQLTVPLTSKKMDKEKLKTVQESIVWEQHNLQEAFSNVEEVPQPPSVEVFLSELCKCRQEKSLSHTMRLLTCMHECGLGSHETLGNYLVPLLVEVGSMCEAQKVFMRLHFCNDYSWNALIAGFVKNGDPHHALMLYQRIQDESVRPSGFTFAVLLKACANLKDITRGLELHDEVARVGLQKDLFVGSSLVDMYSKCGCLAKAQEAFDNLKERDVVSWNALIAGNCKQKLFDKILELYKQMQKCAVVPSSITYVSLLKACCGLEAIDEGQELHIEIVKKGFERDLDVGNELIEFHSSCGLLAEAEEVCHKLSSRDTQTWTALVAGYCKHKLFLEALSCFEQMQFEGIALGVVIFVNVLKAFGSLADINRGQGIHSELAKKGLLENNLIGTALVDMYSNFGLVAEAQKVFNNLLVRDTVSWTALIAGYSKEGHVKQAANCFYQMTEEDISPDAMSWNVLIAGFAKHGHAEEALDCLQQMQSKGNCPDSVTFVFCLNACGTIGAIGKGQDLHIDIAKKDIIASDSVIGNALVDFYATSGLFAEAQHVFNELLEQDVVSWTSLIAGYTKHGMGHEALNLFEQMQLLDVVPNTVTFVCSLKACGSTKDANRGQEIHDDIEKRAFANLDIVGNALVDMYANCGLLMEAEEVFDKLPSKDMISWTALIAGFAKHGYAKEALSYFEQMKSEGVIPDVVAWSAVLAGYAMHNCGEEALICLEEMKRAGISPDAATCASSLKACGGVRAIQKGQEIHTEIARKGFLERDDVVIGNSLIDMYATCGLLVEAQDVFDKLLVRDAVSWTSLIAGYTKHGFGETALHCFGKMQTEGFSPDAVTFICLLKACGVMGAASRGQELHEAIIKSGLLETDVYVGNALLDMYIDCALLAKALDVFDKLPVKDVVSWNALIAGYAKDGCSEEAIACFEHMQLISISLDTLSGDGPVAGYACRKDTAICAFNREEGDGMYPSMDTYISILTACSHGGLVHFGQFFFQAMRNDSTITPTIEHYVCMIDLYGRTGQLRNALAVFEQMPYQPHLVVLHTVLGACRKWGDVDTGRQAFDYALVLDDRDAGAYVCMSNIYAAAGMQEDAKKVDVLRAKNQAWQDAKHTWCIADKFTMHLVTSSRYDLLVDHV